MQPENDSSTGGPLQQGPVFGLGPEVGGIAGLGDGYLNGELPLEDQALDVFLQGLIVGITGLDGKVVFPIWQAEPPVSPDFDKDWASIGVIEHRPDTFAAIVHSDGLAGGQDELRRHEFLQITASFFGPNAGYNCGILSDGLQIGQNREPLTLLGMGLVETTGPMRAPVLTKMRWRQRYDLHITIKRQRKHFFKVLNLEGVQVGLKAESGSKLVIDTTINED